MDAEAINSLLINRERLEDKGVVRFTSETRWGEKVVRITDVQAQGWDAVMETVAEFFQGQELK